jgi:copper(I)-binding protein
VQGPIGVGSTVTHQYGFNAQDTLIGATNNYGFFGNIPTGENRWNFYAEGTAPNYFAGDIRTNTVVTQATVPTNSNTAATFTVSSLLSGIRTGTPTASVSMTLPTGANMDAAFTSLQNNQSFEWSYINLATATHTVTMLANTTHTVVGNMVVQPNTSARFITRKTAANTFITYRGA